MTLDIPLIWAILIAVGIGMYVILDGFDLGMGILFPFAKSEEKRDTMMNSVAPFWDGNETWLVLGGGGLWVAFPSAYAAVMPAFYFPVTIMLLALIFRGIAFEFRWVSKPSHLMWDVAFAGGSIIAAFCQGIILGGFLDGIKLENGAFAGGTFDWATPFALACGVAMLFGYALLGATWLIMRTEGPITVWAHGIAQKCLVVVCLFAIGVSMWTAYAIEPIATRWFSTPNIYFLWLLPAFAAAAFIGVWIALERSKTFLPFFGTIFIFISCYIGLIISVYPYMVPYTMTLWDAAAAPMSQKFTLVGALIMLPIILGYIVFVYYTFRGKLQPGEGYH